MTGLPPPIPAKAAALRDQLLSLYQEAQHALQQQLSQAVLTDFKKFHLKQHLDQVDAVLAGLSGGAAGMPEEMIALHYRHGADLAGHALVLQDIDVKALNMGNQIHTAGVQAVAEQMLTDLASATDQMGATAKQILRKTQQNVLEEERINGLLAGGMISGETYRDTSRRLRDELVGRVGEGKLVQAGQRRFEPARYADLVVRTRTREAVTAGALNRGLEYGVTLYQISVHDTSCPVCTEFQGKVYSTVANDRFPYLERRPPYHPNCRHVLVPYVPDPAHPEESEALAALSSKPGPIADGSVGFAEAMALAEELANTKLAAKAAEKLAAQQAAAQAAQALRAAKKPVLDALNAVPPVQVPEDLWGAQAALQAAAKAIKDSPLAGEELTKAIAKLKAAQETIRKAAQTIPANKLKNVAWQHQVKGWKYGKKSELVEYFSTTDPDVKQQLSAAWVQAGKEAVKKAKAAKEAAEQAAKKAEVKALVDKLDAAKATLAGDVDPKALADYAKQKGAFDDAAIALASKHLEPDDVKALGDALKGLKAQAAQAAESLSIHKLKPAATFAGHTDTQWATKQQLQTLLLSKNPDEVQQVKQAIAAKKADSLAKKATKKAAQAEQAAQAQAAQEAAQEAAEEAVEAVARRSAAQDWEALDAAWSDGRGPHTFTFQRDARSLGGAHPKEIWADETGAQWLFKPLHTNSSFYRGMGDVSFLARSEELGYKVQRLLDPDAVEVRFVRMPDGRMGSIQRMEPDVLPNWDRFTWNPLELTRPEIEAIQREQVVDWLISNHDGHAEQFLRLRDGRVLGIDKGQAFKYFPNDRLDWNYNPTSYRSERMAANELFYRMSRGELTLDPAVTERYIRRVENLTDNEYREILRPYAEALYRGGVPSGKPGSIEEFYAAALARKNNLRRDFEKLYSKAMGRRFRFSELAGPQAGAGRTLAKREAAIVREAARQGSQGKEIPIDLEDIEDQRALLWSETRDGQERTVLTLKVRPAAEARLLERLGGADTASPLPEDRFFEDILQAVKTVNHHVSDGAYNQGKINGALRHLDELGRLSRQGEGEVRAMAAAYLDSLAELQDAMRERRKFHGTFRRYTKPLDPGKRLPDAQTELTPNAFTKRQVQDGKTTVLEENVTLQQASRYHGHIPSQSAYVTRFEDGVEAVYVPQQDAGGLLTQKGRLELRAPGPVTEETTARLLERLDRMGLNTASPTPEDMEWLYLQKQAYAMGLLDEGYDRANPVLLDLVRRTDLSAAQKAAKAREELSRVLGRDIARQPTYNPAGAYETGFATRGGEAGYRTWLRSDITEADLDREMAGYALYHRVTSGGGIVDLIEAVARHNGRMVTTEEKFRLGLQVGGMSPGDDLKTGGAGYFFTRIRKGKNNAGLYFKKRNLLRMDAISYDRDLYGRSDTASVAELRKRTIPEWKAAARNRDTNETILKNGLNFFDEIEEIVVDTERERERIIKALKDNGWAVLPDGRKTENIVRRR